VIVGTGPLETSAIPDAVGRLIAAFTRDPRQAQLRLSGKRGVWSTSGPHEHRKLDFAAEKLGWIFNPSREVPGVPVAMAAVALE
jgi:hypothetical protein